MKSVISDAKINRPRFDVIITTFRRPGYALAAVKSCLSQGDLLSHVIVVDDASGDDTPEWLASLNADWSIHIDDDWELMPGALEKLADLARQADDEVVMLGGRILWDDGHITPEIVPKTPINYEEQLAWRSRPDSLGSDNLCCVSRRVREAVNWPAERACGSILFYLNAALVGKSIYTQDCLALEKSSVAESFTRGDWTQRLARREYDAPSCIRVAEEFLRKHGAAAQIHGKGLLASVYRMVAMCLLLEGQWWRSILWSIQAVRFSSCSRVAIMQLFGSLLGKGLFRVLYAIRG